MKILRQALFKSQLDKMSESKFKNNDDPRITRLEMKVNLLLALVVLQSIGLFFMFVSSLIPSAATLVIMLVLALIAVFLLNTYLPGWAGFVGRMIGSTIRSFQAAARQSKDSVKEDF
jgi:hypothetical protein